MLMHKEEWLLVRPPFLFLDAFRFCHLIYQQFEVFMKKKTHIPLVPEHLQLQGIKYWSALKKCLCIPKNADELISASSAAFEVDFSADKGVQERQGKRERQRHREGKREHCSDYFHLCLGAFYYSPAWHICTLCKFSTNMRHRLSETAISHLYFLPCPPPPQQPCFPTVWRLMTNVACLLASHLFSYNRFNPLEWPFVNGDKSVFASIRKECRRMKQIWLMHGKLLYRNNYISMPNYEQRTTDIL